MTGEGRTPVEVLKVSATSKPVAVAGAIADPRLLPGIESLAAVGGR